MGAYEISVVLGLTAVVLYLFLREVWPVSVTALFAMAVLMLVPARAWSGPILSPMEGLSGFSSQATVAVLAMFVLSAGVERSGAVAFISQRLSVWAGSDARRQVLTLGAVAGPLSGVVNNTPVVAVLIPVAQRIARAAGHSPSRVLMPLSFFAMLGGTLTLIGTSTSLLGNALLPGLGVEPFDFFSFTLVGVVGLAVAALYFGTIGLRLLPDHDDDVVARFDLKGFMAEFEVTSPARPDDEQGDQDPDDDADGGPLTVADCRIDRANGLRLIRLVRGGRAIPSPAPSFVLQPKDVLVVQGSRSRLEALPGEVDALTSLPELRFGLSARLAEGDPDAGTATAELVVTAENGYQGMTISEVRFHERFDVIILAAKHRDRVPIGPLSRTRLQVGDVLLVQGSPRALEVLQESSRFVLTRSRDQTAYRTDKVVTALAILTSVVVAAALGWASIVAAALAGAVAMVITGCLRIEEFVGAIHWNIILLLAGIIPLGVAMVKSGAADLLAQGLTVAGGPLPPILFLMLVFLGTSIVTEMISNNASVVLLLPIVVAAATALGLDGRPFALAVMLAASTSMLSPVGYQTNTMVYGPGNYRFADFLRVGGPLNMILVVVLPLVIAWLFPL